VVRGTPERDRQAQPRQRRQDAVEQRGVFHRELAREPAGARIVDVELRLHAAEGGRMAAEGLQRTAQLVGLRAVLGVIHYDILAARELQRVVERLGLGARPPVGHDDGAKVRRRPERQQRRLRLEVGCLQDEQDLELGARIVERAERGDEVRQDIGLAEQGNQHRIDGQLPIREGWRAPLRLAAACARGERNLAQGGDAQQGHTQEGQCHRTRERTYGGLRPGAHAADDEPDGDGRRNQLPGPDHHAPGRAGRLLPIEAAHGPVDPLGPPTLLEHRLDAKPWRQRHLHAARPQGGNPLAQGVGRARFRAQDAPGPAGDAGGQSDAVEIGFLGGPEVEHRPPGGRRHTQTAGQSRGIGRRRQRTARQQRVVCRHAATARLGPCPPQGVGVDAVAEEKIVLVPAGRWRCNARWALLQGRRRR
jgi:hypothetical protein